jgi:hypothetical protein
MWRLVRSVSRSLTGSLSKCLPFAVAGWLSTEQFPVRGLARGWLEKRNVHNRT